MAFPQERALKEDRTIVFADQSGFYLLPMVVRTYAPVGRTPILHERLGHDHLSAMSAVTLDGRLYMTFQEKAFNEAFNFKLSLRLIRNPNMAVNGRFPTAVGDFKYEISN